MARAGLSSSLQSGVNPETEKINADHLALGEEQGVDAKQPVRVNVNVVNEVPSSAPITNGYAMPSTADALKTQEKQAAATLKLADDKKRKAAEVLTKAEASGDETKLHQAKIEAKQAQERIHEAKSKASMSFCRTPHPLEHEFAMHSP